MAELATVARPYAEALFRVAKAGQESYKLADWSDLVSELTQVGAHPEVQAFAHNPSVSDNEVEATFLSLLKSPLNGEAKNFLKMLVENGRISSPVCWLYNP